MRVVINGLPFFANKLANDLSEFNQQHHFVFCNTYYSFFGRVKFMLNLPFADVVISLNGVSDNSPALNWVLKFKKKIILIWTGTDVSNAIIRIKNKTAIMKYINHAVHFCDSKNLMEELQSVNINCTRIGYKWIPDFNQENETYKSVSMFSYLGKGRENFYGWQAINELAIENPDIQFIIAGSAGKDIQHTDNVKFLGWVSQAEMFYHQKEAAIFVRLTEHDGYSLAVLEALSTGAEVIWSMPHKYCHWAKNRTDIREIFNNTIQLIKERELTRNQRNIEFIKNNFSREVIFTKLLNEIEKIAKS